jgi:aspartyl-tRNA(Asn)/glutamyl-tRNA(Gln) amidotransferase subunit C
MKTEGLYMDTKIDAELVRHVAHLSMLDIKESDIPGLAGDMQKIITLFSELAEVNTDDVTPYLGPVREFSDYYQKSEDKREDIVRPSLSAELILQNAPDQAKNQFRLQAVIEGE